MAGKEPVCPDCESASPLTRRTFLRRAGGVAAAAAGASAFWPIAESMAASTPQSAPETAVKALYDMLSEKQKSEVCFDWDHQDKDKGLLRTFVANNWHITKPAIESEFYTSKQKLLIHDIFQGVFNPGWHDKFTKQLKDDTDGKPWGADQNIAIFGKPGEGKFEFVMTGRHMTIRADGNSEAHVAWGGPIFHGHAADGFNEKPSHPGNIFWHQALLANETYKILDGKQRKLALIEKLPKEQDVDFQGPNGKFPGIPVKEMSRDQREHVEKVLTSLIEPYRKEDRQEVLACLKKQGGLEACSMAFYQAQDLGNDGVWDNWRLEGPAFAWYFRGSPHVHIWINVADDPSVKLND
jgi:hypothetical protein